MDEEHRNRRRANLAGGLFLLVLLGLAVWTVKLFVDQEALQRCLDSRRADCFPVENGPPRDAPRAPVR